MAVCKPERAEGEWGGHLIRNQPTLLDLELGLPDTRSMRKEVSAVALSLWNSAILGRLIQVPRWPDLGTERKP